MEKKKWIFTAAVAAALLLFLLILFWPKAPDVDTVGICYREKTTEQNREERAALESLLTEKGLKLTVVDADGDQAKQLTLIGELANQGCDSLVVEPVMSDAAKELLQALDATGLPAVLMNRRIDTALLTPYSKLAYIGVDPTEPGKLQAQMLTALSDGGDINGDGVVSYMLLQGPENHQDAVLWKESLEKALAESGKETEQLTAVCGDWTRESGKKLCSQEIAKYGKDIEVIFCGNDQMALGALEAIADGGRTVGIDVYLYGIGGDQEALQKTKDRTLSGTVYTDPVVYRTAVVNTVVSQIQGKSVDKLQIIPYTTITEGNIQRYLTSVSKITEPDPTATQTSP